MMIRIRFCSPKSNYFLTSKHGAKNFGEKRPIENFKWYLDLRKFGSVPHSGFGLGIERTVAWISGTKHIRETIPYPRTMYRLEP